MPHQSILIERRKADFPDFYNELIPSLVDFVGKLGISPSHQVLIHAPQCASFIDDALRDMIISNEEDRNFLLVRSAYFIGEYFAQKFSGSWHANAISGSRFFGRYVVGKFSKIQNTASMIDPFEIAQFYIDSAAPRRLVELLAEVEKELADI